MSATQAAALVAAAEAEDVPAVHGLIDGTWIMGAGDVKETRNRAHGEIVTRYQRLGAQRPVRWMEEERDRS